MRKSIAKKLVVYFLLLSLTSTAIIGIYSYRKARAALIDRTFEQLISIRNEKENRLNAFFNQQISEAKSIAVIMENNCFGKDSIPLLNAITAFLQSSQSYSSVILYYSDGSERVLIQDTLNLEKPLNYFSQIKETFQNFANDTMLCITELKPGLNQKFSSLLIQIPLEKDSSKQLGWVVFEIKSGAINDIMFEVNPHNGLGESGEAYLVGDDFIMRSNSRFTKNAINQQKVNTFGVLEAFEGNDGTQKIKDYRGVPVFSAYKKLDIEGLNWVLLAEIDVQEAMIPIYNIRNNIIYLSVLIALLLIGIVALLAKMIAAPIKNLQTETEQVSRGIYGKTIENERQDEIGALINAFNQMTQQLKEQSLKLEEQRLLRLSSMIDGQEMERQRLSRELHDSLGQLMLATKMKLEKALQVSPEDSREIVTETLEHFSATIQEVRNISNNLMPAVLIEFGLVTGLRNLVSEVNKTTRELVSFNSEVQTQRFDKKTETYLFRIAQEGLNNALKHAKASEICIELRENSNKLILQITDDGLGMTEPVVKGNGLLNMRERAKLLGGEMRIDSNMNAGCIIRIQVPK